MVFGYEDVKQNVSSDDYEDKYVIIRIETFTSDFADPSLQLFKVVENYNESEVYGYYAIDGEDDWISKCDILGVATEAAIMEWQKITGKTVS
jgi:hypothetical protein